MATSAAVMKIAGHFENGGGSDGFGGRESADGVGGRTERNGEQEDWRRGPTHARARSWNTERSGLPTVDFETTTKQAQYRDEQEGNGPLDSRAKIANLTLQL